MSETAAFARIPFDTDLPRRAGSPTPSRIRHARYLPVALTLLFLTAPALGQAAAEVGTSEWGPLGFYLSGGSTGEGLSGALGLELFVSRHKPSTKDESASAPDTDSVAPADPDPDPAHRLTHSFDFEVGHIELDADQDFMRRIPGLDPELEIFQVSAGYRLTYQCRLPRAPEDTSNPEHWNELRWFLGAGPGLYDLGPTRRLGLRLRLGARYAFGLHASRAIEVQVNYHRPASGLELTDFRIGYAWRLRRR